MTKPAGHSFNDPMYAELEAGLEQKYGLPAGGMSAIRTKGERSNSDQVSPVGAHTVYQIMPATRDLFLKTYKVDANSGPAGAAEVAALHLRDGMKRTGSWAGAVKDYIGGPDARQHGPVTNAYVNRVLGAGGSAAIAAPQDAPPLPPVHMPSIDEMIHSTPDRVFAGDEQAMREAKMNTPPKAQSVSDMMRVALTGGDGVIQSAPVDTTAVNADYAQTAADEATATKLASYGAGDRIMAGLGGTLTARMVEAIGAKHQEFDPAWIAQAKNNWRTIHEFAQTDIESSMLDEATSAESLRAIQGRIEDERQRQIVLNSSGHGMGVAVGTGIFDPVGIAAGVFTGGVGKAVGLGEAALAAGTAGKLAYTMGENMVGNLAVTAGLDAAGEYLTPQDYATSALVGMLIGVPMTFIKGAGAYAKPATPELRGQITEGIAAGKRVKATITDEVKADLGEDATPEAVKAEVDNRYTKMYQEQVQYTLADIPSAQKLMVGGDLLTDNPDTLAAVVAKHDTAAVSDPTERGLVTEQIARAGAVVKANPIDTKTLNTILEKVGMESTALRLLKSDSDVAKAVGITLLENPTGAGGRGRSAAIATAQRSRLYNEHFAPWDRLQDTFRKQEGITAFRDFYDGKARNRFNERVRNEVESRGSTTHTPDENIQVQKAADLWESGMDMMRKDQQHVGAIGSERLGATSVGYAPHRLDPRRVLAMSADKEAMTRVRGILSSQFQEHEGYDLKFSDKLAAKYLERAVIAAKGSYAVPFNLHSPEAGQMVREALEAMNVHGDELEGMMMKFTRGGAGHTKARLKIDLSADIGGGKKLADLFIKDMPQLYRAYSRRVAGEVSLAQYGVMGKKGLDVLRRAIDVSGGSPKDLESFDQIAAEFLNTPYGTHNHKWMDNLRVATSAARLGGMGFTQFAEWGNAIPAVGVQGMTSGIASMPRILAEVSAISKGKGTPNPILQSLDTLGGKNGLEDYHLTRMFDVRDNDIPVYGSEAMGLGSRMLQTASHKVMIMTGHRMILASQVRSMSEQIVRKAVTFAKSGGADTALDDMGIHAGLRDALKADLDKIATFDAKGNLESLDLFKGEALKPAMVNELVQAVERGAGQIIQRTYIGETGAWAHNGLLKLLFQFRTFSLIAVEKQWGRNVQNYGALKSFMHLAGTASFALPIYLARLQTNMVSMDATKAKDYWEKNSSPLAMSRAVLNYASASGMAGDITDVMAGFASNYGGDFGDRFGTDYNVRGKRTDQLVGGLVAPGLGLAQDAWGGIMHGDLQKIARSAPGGNLPYVSPFVAMLPKGHTTKSQ